MNALPEKVSFQLKVLPAEGYIKTIAKATELLLIYQRAESRDSLAQIRRCPSATRTCYTLQTGPGAHYNHRPCHSYRGFPPNQGTSKTHPFSLCRTCPPTVTGHGQRRHHHAGLAIAHGVLRLCMSPKVMVKSAYVLLLCN